MNNSGRNLDHAPGISLVDIYFVIFRRKWLILFFTAIGVASGLGYFLLKQPPFQSTAVVMIKYITESRPDDIGNSPARTISLTEQGLSVMNSEMKILSSFDLFEQVATNVGPEILAKLGGGNDPIAAAAMISKNFRIEPIRDSGVIQLTFQNPEQTIVAPVLSAIIDEYLSLHMKFHSVIGISDALLTEKASSIRAQIALTDSELHMVKTNAGIVDVDTEKKNYSDEIALLRRELFKARQELADHQADMNELSGSKNKDAKLTNSPAEQKIPAELLTRYKSACSRLSYFQTKLNDYLLTQGYTEDNKLVKEAQQRMAELAKSKNQMEDQCPALAALDFSSVSQPSAGTGATMQFSSLPTRIKTLEEQLKQVQTQANSLGDAEQKIDALLRKKKVGEAFLATIETTLEKARISEDMGQARANNISTFQHPTPPARDFKSHYKKIYAMLFGGLGFGLALAFLLEFFIDRSIKRPIEVQTKLKIPFFLSIPDLNAGKRPASRKMLSAPERKQLGYTPGTSQTGGALTVKAAELEVMSWEVNRRFDSYYDALRDRLVVYFESINLTRKPKLVAVTSTHKGAGVSTIAAGLASSLSETGDGRVLLVDMNLENGAAQQFFKGKPNCKLDDALESDTRDGARVQENLYVVTEDTATDRLPRALPKRFASLIPKLKASDYDYIIFDMPPVSPTSVTARLSGFMDTVMLVIEAEKTDVQVVQQANALLAQSKANVTAVLNKTKTYIPKQLHQDFLSDV